MTREHDRIRDEFTRAAPTFSDRTAGRFSSLGVVAFSGARAGDTVVEVGSGTGEFLSEFARHAGLVVGVDLTPAMLVEARSRHPRVIGVNGDGARLPLRTRSVDLVASAQALHHIAQPFPVVREMRRVLKRDGRMLIVDQIATEKAEEALAMNELDLLRDPSHAACRPASALRILLGAAGLVVEKEKVVESVGRFSDWMPPQEFPSDRVARVRALIAERGGETGMDFRRDGDDWLFTRRRVMLLARRA
ncbi:MAG TPA: class I SAM-dependent methyltransferase [Actinomycetota bacterium]|nr:class I SAM-dependent methyltransferase [Actinomycetota bacterium]